MSLLERLFDPGFMPHGHCFFWRPEVLWLNAGSDALIAAAYFAIPVALARVARGRRDLQMGGMALMFSAFIFACGLTHAMAVWTVWHPSYAVAGLVKLATAGISLATAVALWPLVPRILHIPSQRQLQDANAALSQEVEERRRAEQELQQLNQELRRTAEERDAAEEGFRDLVEAAPDAMMIVDLEGRIQLVNRQAERLFGYERRELLGGPVERLVPERYRGDHAEKRRRFARDPKPRTMEARRELHGLRKDGSEFPVEISLSPVQRGEGFVVASAIRDATLRTQQEEHLRSINEELEQRVARRTAELEERARDLARSNTELEQFAYVVSHDLKSPMRGISALAEWISEDYAAKLDDEGRNQLDLLRARAERMHQLIDGVLQYSRAGRVREPRSIDTQELVSLVLDGLAAPENVRISVGELPVVEYDESQLTQVFQNLVGNAICHAPKDAKLEIEISASRLEEGWRFSVRDNGPGIAPEYHKRIFRIFQTLGKPGEGATGIGLAIVKKIVESNGGEVSLESHLGQGAAFYFTISPRG
jgi:PAS domain S-box-containing protein